MILQLLSSICFLPLPHSSVAFVKCPPKKKAGFESSQQKKGSLPHQKAQAPGHAAHRLRQNRFVFLTLQLQQYVHLLSFLQLLLHSLAKEERDRRVSWWIGVLVFILFQQASWYHSYWQVYRSSPQLLILIHKLYVSYCSNSESPKKNNYRKQGFWISLMFSQLCKVLSEDPNTLIYETQISITQISCHLFANLSFHNPEHNLQDLYQQVSNHTHKEAVRCSCLPWHLQMPKPLSSIL